MARFLHVSASSNRASILEHGLDWQRMDGFGVAGNDEPDGDGVFLCDSDEEATWFTRMGLDSRLGEVDIWEVTLDVELADPTADVLPPPLTRTLEGFLLWPEPIEPGRLRVLRTEGRFKKKPRHPKR